MSKIIACVDGTNISKSICDYGIWFINQLQKPLDIIHVLEKQKFKNPTDYSSVIGIETRRNLLKELVLLEAEKNKLELEHSILLINAIKQYIYQTYNIKINPLQIRGDLLNVIIKLDTPELLILGKNGENTLNNDQIGSNIESITRTFTQPTLIVPNKFNIPKSFLIAFDGSKASQNCIHTLSNTNLLKGLECNLVYVGEPNHEIDKLLLDAETELKNNKFNVTNVILSGNIENSLLDFQTKNNIDLIVVGAYGHSRLEQFFLGSTTRNLLKLSTVPIMLLR